jgi:hypothetical protein
VLVVLLSGCGKPAGGEADTNAVGEFASLTGKEAAFGQSSNRGTLLAIEELNAAGGLLGKKLNFIYEDNRSTPGESATIAKKLITRDHVVAVLGEVASGRSLEAGPICQANKIPMISPSSTNPKVTETGDYIFRVCFTDPFQGKLLAEFADHERLQHPPQQGTVFVESSGVSADQVAGQTGVHQVQLGGFDQALAQIGGPCRQTMNKEHRFQQSQVASQRRVRQTGVATNIREVQHTRGTGCQQLEQVW